jgi:membrane dipeptidase
VAVLLAPEWPRAQAGREDPRVAEVLSGTIGIDMHNHVTPWGTRPEQGRKEQQKSEPNLDMATEPPRLGGLTPFGAAVVKECNRLGIVVDLAHASHETVLGALKVSTQPMIVSHASFDQRTGKNPRMAKMMAPRLISKDHAGVVAEAGGVIGVWTKLSDSMSEYVAGIKALADAIGIDHVGIGTDILSSRPGQSTNAAWPGQSGGFFKAAVAEMLRQGFTPGEIGKIGGGNFCRVFDKVTTGHA